MSRRAAGALAAILLVIMTTPASAGAAHTPDVMRDVIVRLVDAETTGGVADAVSERGGTVTATYRHAVAGLAARVPIALADRLARDPRVAAVEPDAAVRAFQVPTGVRRIGADQHTAADIDGDGSPVDVDVAILDTGIDGAHPDLNVAGGVDCRTGSCAAVTIPTDPNGHGTHVAGTVAARDDGIGVVGVAAGARLHSVRVLEADGTGKMSAVLAGLDWARANADRVETANLSLGCECRSTTLDDAVRAVSQAGVTLVVAAGNAGTDAGGFSPANHPDVIAVAAMSDYDGAAGNHAASTCLPDADDSFASYSNYGAVVDLVAPGSCIRSTAPGGGYRVSTGTSMAAPHVAGAAALYIATAGVARSTTRAATVRQALLDQFSVASTAACGYTDSVSIAPMLHLTCAGLTANTAPTLEVTSPQDGLTVAAGDTVALRASARDAEDGDLGTAIVWTSSVVGRLGTGTALDVQLTDVGDHTIVASVTDSSGANVRMSGLVRVTTANGSTGGTTGEDPHIPQEPEPAAPPSTDSDPQLRVIAPVPESQLLAGRDAQLVSLAVDVEDGDIRSRVRWRSDRDGDLGTGGSVGARLSTGVHLITASVRDAHDHLVERTTAVLVAEPDALGSRSIDDACPPDRVAGGAFQDVDDRNPHAEAIDCIAWWGITQGSDDGDYTPSGIVNRGQMASFLAELIRRSGGSLPDPSGDHFDDDDGTAHEDNINRLAEAGIVKGVTDTAYAPASSVTREQMATFLIRTYEHRSSLALPGIQDRFPDVTSVHEPNVDAAAASGIAAGVAPQRFDPRTPVRRDQMASFVARALDVLVDMNVTAPPA
ncbi:MAG: S8 family serine peptidase [Actinobacteria bacterium]|nr:S8 family serine peptidase [Actinomycetota bacterium]